jgi:hypothetical protein
MTKLLLAVLAVGLSGCLAPPSPIESGGAPTGDDATSDYIYYGDSRSKKLDQCAPYLAKVVVDNSTWYVELPTLCDPNPYIFKGDPGPDMWKKYHGKDPVWQEKIVREALNAIEQEQ